MLINIQDDILVLHRLGLLDLLLEDKTTKRNIMWATDAYRELGEAYERGKEITPMLITGSRSDVMKTRARKALEQQSERTRQHGEVFTPLWICRKMNDYADETWFGRPDVFFKAGEPTPKVEFDREDSWKKYVDSRRLEITCGEAPFLVSRYDVETGEALPIVDRVGVLDRKLRVVNQNAGSEEEWLTWAFRALQATYGYEFQGDNLLIARVNVLMTFGEYLSVWWGRKPTLREYQKAANITAWNLWQMDGLTGTIPYCKAEETEPQMDLFQLMGLEEPVEQMTIQPPCRVYNWRRKNSMAFSNIGKGGPRAMKFSFITGNPPYQDETLGDNKGFAPPIYHLFMDGAFEKADVVELIHPARFLFNAGSTPKEWNKKMLADPHFKVLFYEPDASKFFSNTEIKGGVAITLHNEQEDYGSIGIFTAFSELNSIIKKVCAYVDFTSLSTIAVTSYAYHFTKQLHVDYPKAADKLSKGHAFDLKSNVFERLPDVFFEDRPQDGKSYIQILGRNGNDRVYKYIRADYIDEVSNLYKFKVYIPKANGAGIFGEVLSPPVLSKPGVGSTETFLSIGAFETESEARAALKYTETKFARSLLGTLKTTQDITPQKWKYVPLQDFTSASDIDWSRPIPEIDQQLYAKYGLSQEEIDFIETHVKEMV